MAGKWGGRALDGRSDRVLRQLPQACQIFQALWSTGPENDMGALQSRGLDEKKRTGFLFD